MLYAVLQRKEDIIMTHRTQINLNDSEYHFLRDMAREQKKSIAQIVRDWIDEKRKKRFTKKYDNDSFWKIRGLGSSGRTDIGKNFDEYLYGGKK